MPNFFESLGRTKALPEAMVGLQESARGLQEQVAAGEKMGLAREEMAMKKERFGQEKALSDIELNQNKLKWQKQQEMQAPADARVFLQTMGFDDHVTQWGLTKMKAFGYVDDEGLSSKEKMKMFYDQLNKDPRLMDELGTHIVGGMQTQFDEALEELNTSKEKGKDPKKLLGLQKKVQQLGQKIQNQYYANERAKNHASMNMALAEADLRYIQPAQAAALEMAVKAEDMESFRAVLRDIAKTGSKMHITKTAEGIQQYMGQDEAGNPIWSTIGGLTPKEKGAGKSSAKARTITLGNAAEGKMTTVTEGSSEHKQLVESGWMDTTKMDDITKMKFMNKVNKKSGTVTDGSANPLDRFLTR